MGWRCACGEIGEAGNGAFRGHQSDYRERFGLDQQGSALEKPPTADWLS